MKIVSLKWFALSVSRTINRRILPLLVVSCTALGISHAESLYTVTVNTSSVVGASGFVDFQFDPGFDSQQAIATIAEVTPAASLGIEMLTGDAAGSILGTLTLTNSMAFNDDFVRVTFPSSLSFVLRLGGAAANNPNPAFHSGSTFGFGIFDNNQNPILTSDPNGFAFTVDLGPNGAIQPTIFSNGGNQAVATLTPITTPEPGCIWLMAAGCLLCVWFQGKLRLRTCLARPQCFLVFVCTIPSAFAQSVPFISDAYFTQQGKHQHSVPPGGSDVQLTITGTGFNGNTAAAWSMPGRIGNQEASFSALDTSCSSSTTCTATLPANFTANPTMGYLNMVNIIITPQYTARSAISNTVQFPISYSVPFATVNPAPSPRCGSQGCDRPYRPALSAAGSRPLAVATGDFDGDRLADYAIATQDSNGNGFVEVILQPNLAARTSTPYPVGLSPVAIATGDFNGDGYPDLAVLNQGGNGTGVSTVSVLLAKVDSRGNPTGSFLPRLDFGVGSFASAIVVGDFNEDGKLDIATADCGLHGCSTTNISVLVGYGDGTFLAGPSSNTGSYAGGLEAYSYTSEGLAVTDFNQDGHLDLVVAMPGQNGFVLMAGHGDGTFPYNQQRELTIPALTRPTAVAIADVNGDGYPDIALGCSNGTAVSLGPSYNSAAPVGTNNQSDSLAFGDFNGDGTLDLATGLGPGVHIWIGDGQGGFSSRSTASIAGIGGSALISVDPFGTGRLGVAMVDDISNLVLLEQTPPSVSVPASLPNMSAPVGGSTSQTVTLTVNTDGSAPLNLSDFLNVNATNPAQQDSQFTVSNGPTCPANGGMLLPGKTCQFTVTFSPTSPGTISEWIAVLDDGLEGAANFCSGTIPGAPTCQYSTVQGSGVQLTISPSALTFSASAVGLADPAQQVTVTNSTNASFTFTPVLSGNAGDFQISGSGTCANFAQGFTLATGQSCTFSVTFTPGAAASRTASLVLRSGAVTLTLPMSGSGLTPQVTISTTAIQFPAIAATATSTFQPITVSNMTGSSLTFRNIQVTGAFLESDNCGTAVAPGGSCQFQIASAPTSVGNTTGALTFNDSFEATTRTVSLSGSGTNPVSVSATAFTYPGTPVGASLTQTLVIGNSGGAPLTISNLHLTSPFSETDTCGSPIPASSSCQIQIAFSPTLTGPAIANLTFNDSFDGTAARSVSLSGSGTFATPQINLLRHCSSAVTTTCAPAPTAPGGNSFTLSLIGTGFTSGSTVNWKMGAQSASLAVQSLAQRELKVTVPASLIAAAGSAAITVTNPPSSTGAADGGTSNPVYLNIAPPRRGAGFTTAAAYDTDLAVTGVAVADFNGDGIPDVVSASFDQNTVSVLLGSVNGTFTSKQRLSLANAHDVAVGDFNKDGKPDIIVTQKLTGATYGQLALFPGHGDGTFGAPAFVTVQEGPQSVQVADFNGDGKLDAVTGESGANTQFQFTVVQGNGAGSLTRTNDPGPGTHPVSIAVGDYNRDGIPDVAVVIQPYPTGNGNSGAAGSVAILLGNGDFTFRGVASYGTGAQPQGIATGDFNGDGKLDLAVANEFENTVSILIGNGDGTFQNPAKASVGAFPISLISADFNGDGIGDLAVATCGDMGTGFSYGSCRNGSGAVSILIGNGDGTFQSHADFGSPSTGTPLAIAAGDFNSDGVEDIAVAAFQSGGVRVLLQTVPSSVDVTSQLQIASSGFLMNRTTHSFNGTITITNTSAQPISGPLSLVLNNLPPGVSLINGTGQTSSGAPYVMVPLPSSLTTGQQVTVTLQFSNSGTAVINFTPAVLSAI